MKDGNPIDKLINTCMNFNPSENPGSTIWWWNPPGIFKITSKNTTTRVKVSLNNLPPMILGTATYQADTAVKYQMFTNVCPKLQNNVRLSITLTVSVQPKAQGINVNTSYVTPRLPKNNNTKTPTAKYESSGICFPRFFFLHTATFMNTPNAAVQIPNTRKTKPI